MAQENGLPRTLVEFAGFVVGMRSRRIELAAAGFEPTTGRTELVKAGRIIEHGEGETKCRKKK